MRRFTPSIRLVLLVCVLVESADSPVFAQSSRTAPLPVSNEPTPISNVARTRLLQKQRENEQSQTPATSKSSIPLTPPGQRQTPPQIAAIPAEPADPLLVQVKQAIAINRLRFLNPSPGGHTPWMIMHGVLALRQEYELKVGHTTINAIDYVTQQNPIYVASLPDPLLPPGAPLVHIREHWFQSTAYGGRAQPYVVSFAFEGHTNQFLAILSMADLPLTHTFVVSDPQRPGTTKTITMADMVRHAQMNMHLGNPNEMAWTLWFLTNYLEPDATWIDKDGKPWSMEQLVTTQTNAPMFSGNKLLAPCGGTHGMFALACACNSYQQKHGQLQGAWVAARQKLNDHIAAARRMQNQDGSFSTDFFRTTGWSAEMGPRFKSSGHMLEWLMMALPPEQLKEPWVRKGIESVAGDLIRNGYVGLGTPDTGAMYHALHALVLYRNRVEPPSSFAPPVQVVELPPEMKNPAPGTTPLNPPLPTPPNPDKGVDPKMSPGSPIRLLNPATNPLTPLGPARPNLKPITNSKESEAPPKSGSTPMPPPMPVPPPLAEKLPEPASGEPARIPLLIPTKPQLEQPDPTAQPSPAPSEPISAGAIVKPLTPDEGEATPAPLFGDEPGEMPDKPAGDETVTPPSVEGEPTPALAPAPLVPSLPEPTAAKSPSSSD